MSFEEIQFYVLRAIELNPELTQRRLAEKLGFGLGKRITVLRLCSKNQLKGLAKKSEEA